VTKLVVELGMDQVYLAEVRLLRIVAHPRKVLDRDAGVRVVGDSDPRDQPDAVAVLLAGAVAGAAADRDDPRLGSAFAHTITVSRPILPV
jgi:hypothetical protein